MTNFAELSLHYTIPAKQANITIGLSGSNLAMLYYRAPFDPELAASTTNAYYTGVDYFMHPSLRRWGVEVVVGF